MTVTDEQRDAKMRYIHFRNGRVLWVVESKPESEGRNPFFDPPWRHEGTFDDQADARVFLDQFRADQAGVELLTMVLA